MIVPSLAPKTKHMVHMETQLDMNVQPDPPDANGDDIPETEEDGNAPLDPDASGDDILETEDQSGFNDETKEDPEFFDETKEDVEFLDETKEDPNASGDNIPDATLAETTETQVGTTHVGDAIQQKAFLPNDSGTMSSDEYLSQIFGFNPKALCWKYKRANDEIYKRARDGSTLLNVPQMQYQHYVMLDIDGDTLVQMEGTDSICPEWEAIHKIEKLWYWIKYPPVTWEIIDDNINIFEKFAQYDVNSDGYIDLEEVARHYEESGRDPKLIEDALNEMRAADTNFDQKVSYVEFKRHFFVIPHEFFNADWQVRLGQYSFVIVLPVLCLILLTFANETDIKISLLIGLTIQLMYLVYFATLAYYFWIGSTVTDNEDDTRYLFRVFSRPGTAQIKEGKWAPLRMPLNQIAWPLKAIHSVSEFSAVGGAMPSIMLGNIGQYTWAMVTMHFIIQIAFNDDFQWEFHDFCAIIGVAGLVMLGVFEADPFNDSVNNFHMLGALSGFGTVVAYIVQQNPFDADAYGVGLRKPLALLLALLFIIFYWLWNISLSYTYRCETNSFGIYDAPDEEEEKVKKEEEALAEEDGIGFWDVCCSCCKGCCLLSPLPLLVMLCIGTTHIMAAAKHKKSLKKMGHSKNIVKWCMDFQPALPNWKEEITPQIKRRISTMSIANVLFEGVVLMVGSSALSLWLMDYEKVCHGFCLDQAFVLLFLLLVLVTGIWGSYNVFGLVNSKKFTDVFG